MAILKRESTAFVSKRCVTPIVAPSDYKKLIGATDEIDFANTSAIIPTVSGITTATSIGDTWADELDRQNFGVGQIELPAYIIKAKWRYDVVEETNFEKNIPGLGMQQMQDALINEALGLRVRQLVIHGHKPGEGLVNNTTQANLTGGGWKKDPGELLSELLGHISDLIAGVYSRGRSLKICIPASLEAYLNTALISTSKYLTSGSTMSTGGALKKVLEDSFKKDVEIIVDSTLFTDGDTSKPQMLVVIPMLEAEPESELLSTTFQVDLNDANTYMAISALDKKFNPEQDGYITGYASLRTTAGYNLRKEASLLIKGDQFN